VQGKESWEKDMTGSERLDAQDGETIQPFRDTTGVIDLTDYSAFRANYGRSI
jgi:hypothetical protein